MSNVIKYPDEFDYRDSAAHRTIECVAVLSRHRELLTRVAMDNNCDVICAIMGLSDTVRLRDWLNQVIEWAGDADE